MTRLLHYTILVDGYNLAHQNPQWRRLRLEQAREQVLLLLRQTRWPFPSARVAVFFDAKSPEAGLPSSGGGIQVRFAASADAEIQSAIRDSASPERLAIVSDDGEIVRTAKSHGVRCFSCAWVIQHSVASPPSTTGTRPHDTDQKSSLPASAARRITEELARRWLKE